MDSIQPVIMVNRLIYTVESNGYFIDGLVLFVCPKLASSVLMHCLVVETKNDAWKPMTKMSKLQMRDVWYIYIYITCPSYCFRVVSQFSLLFTTFCFSSLGMKKTKAVPCACLVSGDEVMNYLVPWHLKDVRDDILYTPEHQRDSRQTTMNEYVWKI